MWAGPRPTSVPSGILIHLTVWHNTPTLQTDRQTDRQIDRQTRSQSTGRTCNGRPKILNKRPHGDGTSMEPGQYRTDTVIIRRHTVLLCNHSITSHSGKLRMENRYRPMGNTVLCGWKNITVGLAWHSCTIHASQYSVVYAYPPIRAQRPKEGIDEHPASCKGCDSVEG